MGKQIYLEKIEALFDKSQVVDFKSIERIISEKKKGNYAKLLVYNLLKKGKINRIGEGLYTKHSEVSLSVFSFSPSYLGLQSALSFYGLWEQETLPVIITAKKVRRGIRRVLGLNILLRNISRKHFFGFDTIKEGSFYLPYSDLEKTFIDMVVFNQKMDNKLIKNIQKRINKTKLNRYLNNYNPKIQNKAKSLLKY